MWKVANLYAIATHQTQSTVSHMSVFVITVHHHRHYSEEEDRNGRRTAAARPSSLDVGEACLPELNSGTSQVEGAMACRRNAAFARHSPYAAEVAAAYPSPCLAVACPASAYTYPAQKQARVRMAVPDT